MILKTQPMSVDRGGPGLSFWSLIEPIGQQLTNMAAAVAPVHVR